jgi:hypothetical protein
VPSTEKLHHNAPALCPDRMRWNNTNHRKYNQLATESEKIINIIKLIKLIIKEINKEIKRK